eukprot:Partr_v1_DN5092_c0_g1_i1_m31392 putative beta-d-xylosidase
MGRRAIAATLAVAAAAGPASQKSLQLYTCSDDSGISVNQVWTVSTTDNTIRLVSTGDCISIVKATADESPVYTTGCNGSPLQQWAINANGTISSSFANVLDVSNYGTASGSQVWIFHPTGNTNQQWKTQAYGGGVRIVNPVSNKCLDAGTVMPRTCDPGQPAVGTPLCDTTLDFPTRAAWVVSNLTLAEKIPLTVNGADGVDRLGIPSYQWWSEALHGVAYSPGVHFGGAFTGSTSFPQVVTSGAAWNRTLWHAIGGVVSTEGRAMNNGGAAGLTYWTPNINTGDPRWGRTQETPGEDVYLTSEYAVNLIRGLQEGDDPRYVKVSACAKHYAAYSLEDWNGTQRYGFNAVVTAQDEADTLLAPFGAAVTQGRATSLMCSYNAVNGIPSCANHFILTEVAVQEWNFNGYITSDCDAIGNVYNPHHYTANLSAAVAASFLAGTDIDCGSSNTQGLLAAISDGLMTEAQLDTHLVNLFLVQLRLGMFDPSDSQPYLALGPQDVCTPEHIALALDGAQQGMVLVKNTAGVLPLSKTAVKSVAVVGPSANRSDVMNSNYNGPGCPGQLRPPSVTLGDYAAVNFVQGCTTAGSSTNGFAAATAAAAGADATVIVAGNDLTQEAEGHDRTIISWPGVQSQFIAAVAAAAKGPVVLVVESGGSIDISAELANPKIGAIIWAGYPGGGGGDAIARTIFGDSVPAGRMVTTLYPADYVNQVSLFDMNFRPGPSVWPPGSNPGKTHRFYTGTPVLPFGYGLSYTTFSYTIVRSPSTVSLAPVRSYLAAHPNHNGAYATGVDAAVAAEFWINVTNTGTVDSDDVVQGFLTPPGAGTNGVPLQELFGFERVHVPAGATVSVFLGASAHQLTTVTPDVRRVALEGEWKVRIGVREAAAHGAGFAETSFVAKD